MMEIDKIFNGDCIDILKTFPEKSIDIFFTSPPYAERRNKTYGGISANIFVAWFIEISEEIKRTLKPTGSFFLNIKSHTENGERSLYVMELVIALKNQGFLFIDEFTWIKNAYPGGFQGRFKNGFEPIYHFTTQGAEGITFNPTACGTPIKPESLARASRKQGNVPVSGMAALNTSNLKEIEVCRPSNVIHINNVVNQYSEGIKHPAVFPEKLPEFFIKSFSNEGDIVCDPFCGSGTTCVVAKRLNRKYIGIELMSDYVKMAEQRIYKAMGLFGTV